MKKKPGPLSMLPREIRIRLVAAFALMAVIPLLAGLYLATLHLTNTHLPAYWIKIIIITLMILICAGFIIMRNCVWSIIDIAKTTEQLLSQPKNQNTFSDELLRFEHLLLYLEDQIYAAKRFLNTKRKNDNLPKSFKLPTRVPSSLVKTRLLSLAKNAELNGSLIGVFIWKSSNVSQSETEDSTLVPQWLIAILKNSPIVPDAIGRLKPGYWIGWADNKSINEMISYIQDIKNFLDSINASGISVSAFSHPSESSDLSFLKNSVEILEID